MLSHDAALFACVAIAAGLGYAIGWEREVRGHPAGSRTFALVAAGSAAFTTVAIDAFPSSGERLVAGIVTGIGFMGAGVVLRDTTGHVRGLTTAAAIWSTASVGIAAGASRLVLAALITVLLLVMLELPKIPILKRIDPARWAHRFTSDYDEPTAESEATSR